MANTTIDGRAVIAATNPTVTDDRESADVILPIDKVEAALGFRVVSPEYAEARPAPSRADRL